MDQEQIHMAHREYMENDFLPDHIGGATPPAAERLAKAAEFSAYQLGQINRTLKAILQALKRKT